MYNVVHTFIYVCIHMYVCMYMWLHFVYINVSKMKYCSMTVWSTLKQYIHMYISMYIWFWTLLFLWKILKKVCWWYHLMMIAMMMILTKRQQLEGSFLIALRWSFQNLAMILIEKKQGFKILTANNILTVFKIHFIVPDAHPILTKSGKEREIEKFSLKICMYFQRVCFPVWTFLLALVPFFRIFCSFFVILLYF